MHLHPNGPVSTSEPDDGMIAQGLVKCGCAGIVLLDVDDFLQGGGERRRRLMDELHQRFRFGKWRKLFNSSGEYLGRTLTQLPNYECG